MAKIAKKKPFKNFDYGAKDLKENMVVIAYAKAATRLAKILSIREEPGDPIPWVRVQLMGRKNMGTDVFKPYWLDEIKKDTFVKKKNKKYQEFWVDLYPRDIIFVLKHPLIGGKLDPRDRKEIDVTWGGNLSILLAWTEFC